MEWWFFVTLSTKSGDDLRIWKKLVIFCNQTTNCGGFLQCSLELKKEDGRTSCWAEAEAGGDGEPDLLRRNGRFVHAHLELLIDLFPLFETITLFLS